MAAFRVFGLEEEDYASVQTEREEDFGEDEAVRRSEGAPGLFCWWAKGEARGKKEAKEEETEEGKNNGIQKSSMMRDNVMVMARLQELKNRVTSIEKNNEKRQKKKRDETSKRRPHLPACLPLSSLMMKSLDTTTVQIPPSTAMTHLQAEKLLTESCSITALHTGFHYIEETALTILTEVTIAFIHNIKHAFQRHIEKPAFQMEASLASTKSEPLVKIEEVPYNALWYNSIPGDILPGVISSDAENFSQHYSQDPEIIDLKTESLDSKLSSNLPLHPLGLSKKDKYTLMNANALLLALNAFGCSISDMHKFLSSIVKYGDLLRAVDRKMLKKNHKNKMGKNKLGSSFNSKLTPDMRESLNSFQFGSVFLSNRIQATKKEIIFSSKASTCGYSKKKDSKKRSSPLTNSKLGMEGKKRIKKKAVPENELISIDNISGEDADEKVKLERIDGCSEIDNTGLKEEEFPTKQTDDQTVKPSIDCISQESKLKDEEMETFDGELDLSNLDDLFDGDTMLGDDMLPTSF